MIALEGKVARGEILEKRGRANAWKKLMSKFRRPEKFEELYPQRFQQSVMVRLFHSL